MRDSKLVYRYLLFVAALAILMSFRSAHAQNTQTFGHIVPGAVPSAGLSAQMKRASRFTAPGPGTVRQLCAYLDGKGGVSNYQRMRLALYRDNGGVPGVKMFEAPENSVLAGDAARWICQPVPLQPIPAGNYWIAIHTGENAGVIRDYSDGTATNWYGNADPFDDGAAPTFGAGNAGTGTLSVYAEYFPDDQLRNAGRTTIGTIPSGGMTADMKRGSSFVMTERGKLYGITAYLDGGGANQGPYTLQMFRYVLYKDANGVPGAKLYESTWEQGFRTTWPAAWVTETTRSAISPTLDPGRYWIVIHTGQTSGVIRNFADGSGNWYGNADTYSDGASAQFGPGNAGNGTISAFISYRPGTITADTIGRTDIGTSPSAGLSANASRWSRFELYEQNPPLTGLHAYLDGLGAVTGSQKIRMVVYGLYANRQTSYYAKIAQSQDVTITAGMSPQWVNFPVASVPLDSQYPSYLIALQTGDTAGVIRDYGDSRPEPTGNWYSIADPFADGALDQVPTNISTAPNSSTLSVYATYALPPPSP
jgi:hypothetical protein